jgi:membrane-bound lytic murein transglycosylase D
LNRTSKVAVLLVVALLQACATPSSPPPSPAPEAEAVLPEVTPAPVAQPPPARAAKPSPAARAPSVPLEVARLPPFDGERREIKEVLRGIKTIDGTAAAHDVWQRVRQGFAMPDLDNALVRRKTREYAARPEYLQRMLDRSRIYLYHIVAELEKRGLPTELALLPMVESAFNPMAYSRAHASGLWQFIPGTGRRFDLEQNLWYDGRRDVVDSTDAALDYLTKLYKMYGDWHLALASYNCGENAVARAVARNRKAHKPTDFWSLRLPKETRNYVPKLQALKNIIANPSAYGVDLDPIPNEPYFTVVSATPELDLALAARLAEMPVEDFIALNPGFSRPLIRSSAGARIVLPSEKVGVFHTNLAKHDPDSLVSWRVYHPQRGETLGAIAKKFHMAIAELKRVNGIRATSWHVPATLVVPIRPDADAELHTPPLMYAPPIAAQGAIRHVHRVKAGETLSAIATRYRVRLSDLKRWNPGSSVLRIGQKIYIRAR